MRPSGPHSPYGVSKALGEAAARFHAETSDLSTVCLRIGTVRLDDRPAQPRHFATLLTHRDLLSLVDAALSAPAEVRFGIYYGVSANTWRIWDMEPAGRELDSSLSTMPSASARRAEGAPSCASRPVPERAACDSASPRRARGTRTLAPCRPTPATRA